MHAGRFTVIPRRPPVLLSAFPPAFTLVEVLVVIAILGVCAAIGAASFVPGMKLDEARGAAASWQAASAWAQLGELWQGGSVQAGYEDGGIEVTHDLALCGGRLGASAPVVPVSTNVGRWVTGNGVAVRFGGLLASPDTGGSLYFDAFHTRYRVVVRPESGLTVRSCLELHP